MNINETIILHSQLCQKSIKKSQKKVSPTPRPTFCERRCGYKKCEMTCFKENIDKSNKEIMREFCVFIITMILIFSILLILIK